MILEKGSFGHLWCNRPLHNAIFSKKVSYLQLSVQVRPETDRRERLIQLGLERGAYCCALATDSVTCVVPGFGN